MEVVIDGVDGISESLKSYFVHLISFHYIRWRDQLWSLRWSGGCGGTRLNKTTVADNIGIPRLLIGAVNIPADRSGLIEAFTDALTLGVAGILYNPSDKADHEPAEPATLGSGEDTPIPTNGLAGDTIDALGLGVLEIISDPSEELADLFENLALRTRKPCPMFSKTRLCLV